MASFTLRAYPAWRYRDSHGRSTLSRPFESIGAAQKIEARNVAAIAAAVAVFGKQIQADAPDASFSIAVIIGRGGRKPNGFDAAYAKNGFGQDAWLDERDYEGRPLPATVTPPAIAA